MRTVSGSGAAILMSSVLALGALAGCGSDDSDGGGATTSAATTGADVQVPAPPTTPPPFPGKDVFPPLPEAPPTDKTVAYLKCEVSSCDSIAPGFEAAAEALGWKLETIASKLQAPGPAMETAIQAGVDYIVVVGADRALYEPQLEQAHAKGIDVFSTSDPTPPDPDAGLMAQVADGTSLARANDVVADWIIRETQGEAKIAYVTVPDLPIIAAGADGFRQRVEAKCPECSLDDIEVTIEDLGRGTIPSKVVAFLQTHPDVTDLVFSFGDLFVGVPAALDGAGLGDVRRTMIADIVPEQLRSGELAAGSVQGVDWLGWAVLDQMARVATDSYDPAQEREAAIVPTWVLDSEENARFLTDGLWPGPEGYQERFKDLWQVAP